MFKIALIAAIALAILFFIGGTLTTVYLSPFISKYQNKIPFLPGELTPEQLELLKTLTPEQLTKLQDEEALERCKQGCANYHQIINGQETTITQCYNMCQ